MKGRPRLGRATALAAIVVVVILAVGPAARAYVRAKTPDGIPVYWTTSCATATVYLNGFSMMSRDEVAKSLGAAAHAWSPDAVTCTASDGTASHPTFEIVPAMATSDTETPTVGVDGHNVVVFHLNDWPVEFSPSALAVTSLTKKRDGRILDADVEINAQWLEWANLDPGAVYTGNPQVTPFDLQDAITHELGHFIGLDHTCFGPADAERQVDNNGDLVPICGVNVPPAVQQTVMYAIVEPGEVTQRVLSPDDVAAVCDVYPAARDPKTCVLDQPDDGCGCAAVRGRPPALSAGLFVAGAMALALRRRARRAARR